MRSGTYDLLRRRAPVDASRWIAGTVAFIAIGLFAFLSPQVLPTAMGLMSGSPAPEQVPVTPLILCIALVLLAWRRSVELKKAAQDRAEADARSHNLAYKDDVTGLFNRRFLNERLKTAPSDRERTLILLDLDHFKKVNDLYGHAAGDKLLVSLSERLLALVPPEACCARLGGDEFAIFLSGECAGPEAASALGTQIQDELSKPVQLDGSVACVGVSVGMASLPAGQLESESLLRRSDIAMYEAKRLGRNCCVWFDQEMERQLNERNRLEAEMRQGIVEGQFIPYFQPMMDLASGKATAFEVLARWNHPTRGIVEPDDFIPVAEATGMISDLSFSVMRAALIRAGEWPDVTIAVNISPVQFKDPLLAQRIMKILNETGFPAGRLELEMTESAILDDREMALSTISSLKNFGVRISLDDFGTGYASLSQLRDLPFDRIKIDRSFVASLLEDKQSNAIVHAIATLGKSLNLPITAEGVESETVHQRLQDLGCSDAQGWLFGRAISGDDAAERFFALAPLRAASVGQELIEAPTKERRNYLRRGQ